MLQVLLVRQVQILDKGMLTICDEVASLVTEIDHWLLAFILLHFRNDVAVNDPVIIGALLLKVLQESLVHSSVTIEDVNQAGVSEKPLPQVHAVEKAI